MIINPESNHRSSVLYYLKIFVFINNVIHTHGRRGRGSSEINFLPKYTDCAANIHLLSSTIQSSSCLSCTISQYVFIINVVHIHGRRGFFGKVKFLPKYTDCAANVHLPSSTIKSSSCLSCTISQYMSSSSMSYTFMGGGVLWKGKIPTQIYRLRC